jgi:hypothetical protein
MMSGVLPLLVFSVCVPIASKKGFMLSYDLRELLFFDVLLIYGLDYDGDRVVA